MFLLNFPSRYTQLSISIQEDMQMMKVLLYTIQEQHQADPLLRQAQSSLCVNFETQYLYSS